MAWINKYTFGLINAYAMRQRFGGGEFAVFMRQPVAAAGAPAGAPVISHVARHPPGLIASSTNTAIVNGIQNGALDNQLVFTTYVPTVACIGAMKTHGLNSVTYVDVAGQSRIQAVRANPNVNTIVPAALPATAVNNRFLVPPGYLPPPPLTNNGTSIDPTQGARALSYLTAIARLGPLALGAPPPTLTAWRATWGNPGGVAGARVAPALNHVANAGPQSTAQLADFFYMLLVYSIAGRAAGPAYQGARIAGVIASRTGRIYSWHVNQRAVNTTYHAETNAVQAFGAPIPADATLYSTLEPCHQCAALFVRAGGQRCVFGQHDPNMTNNTALHAASTRFQGASTLRDALLPPLVAGDRLDQIRIHSTAANQAAAVARARLNPNATATIRNMQAARAHAHPDNLQTRVLDILNAPPTMDLWRRADEMLDTLITRGRLVFPHGGPVRAVVESCAQVRAALP